MSTFHPTRRDVFLVLTCFLVLGLFLQFDFSLRFDSSWGGSGSRYNEASGWRGGSSGASAHKDAAAKAKWIADSNTGIKSKGVSDARVKWDDGPEPVRTEVLSHAPGWTIFDSIYLFNGTWYIVTDNPSSIPLLRMMVSTGNEIWNGEEEIKSREPTEKDMRIIFPSEARKLWGTTVSTVDGPTMLINDPPQFLDHYYHFCAELLVGLWRTYASLDPTITSAGITHLPPPARMMFPHTAAGKWNDYAKMNSFITRAIFPSMSFEFQQDFLDRADTARAFVFERVVFADRAAAFRGPEFQRTWRTAAEAMTLPGSVGWWSPLRKNLIEFVLAGSNEDALEPELSQIDAIYGDNAKADPSTEIDIEALEEQEEAMEEALEEKQAQQAKQKQVVAGKPVITYVSRQEWGRRMLRTEDHQALVKELETLREKYGWEVNIVSMDKLSREEQIRLSARTTIMIGLHGNGLSHLLWMNAANPRATVIEFFFPGGFAEDYEFTARALGIKHYGVWNAETFTEPDLPQVAYPEGFQGNDIPLNGKTVADLIVKRLLVEKHESKDVEGGKP
ncbi:hypothetical protein BD324DRAFT_629619 [Kockovaella imperatae]|uniref:Glycosyltransferase 61 catalytic domain-containing protein n=1 Tax=Kockovaella imperatae TaxID=4999 RepID=A0A1Y1UD30_9TREE|nr:hypothetical protein BD324DRAFT_629619 [Kockovaella imperatae]ORX35950.1 hypothetical protein BD324DRAFT_629619 [Kockovaella imperatae]